MKNRMFLSTKLFVLGLTLLSAPAAIAETSILDSPNMLLSHTTAKLPPQTYRMPFSHFRAFLPADGNRVVVWKGVQNKWPQNKDNFERHETAEISFGKGIRAKQRHRGNETSLSPGITAENGYIHLQGGWALHKAVKWYDDYYDGEFQGDVFFSIKDGKVQSNVRNFRFSWNESFIIRFLPLQSLLQKHILIFLAQKMQTTLNSKLNDFINEKLRQLIIENPEVIGKMSQISLKIEKDSVAITINPYINPNN